MNELKKLIVAMRYTLDQKSIACVIRYLSVALDPDMADACRDGNDPSDAVADQMCWFANSTDAERYFITSFLNILQPEVE